MDKRAEKSKTKIYNAYMELIAKKELRKITVKELCVAADVNKSTFYAHFEDIYDLSEYVENCVIKSVVTDNINTDNIIDNSQQFTNDLFKAMNSKKKLIETVFSGNRKYNLADKISENLKSIIFIKYPQMKNNMRFNILLDYVIFGGYYAYSVNINANANENYDEIISVVVKASNHMNTLLRNSEI
ncbi:MAG: TetR/AcrR family transcriptional regulator [Ruminococcus sp.]|nr:TetR/AcrR family transcriptional regulator [Ruminococcus sp.]